MKSLLFLLITGYALAQSMTPAPSYMFYNNALTGINVLSQNVKGDGTKAYGCSVSGVDVTCLGAVFFLPSDVGKSAVVSGAGVSGAAFSSTIASYVTGTHVQLASPASTATTNTSSFYWYTSTDPANIQTLVMNNPNGTLDFPAGTYTLNNSGQFGIQGSAFTGSITMAPGAKFVCLDSTSAAMDCIRLTNANGAVLQSVTVGFADETLLPLARSSASGSAVSIESSSNFTLLNATVEAGPGVGVYVRNSPNLNVSVARISNTTADGLHLENCSGTVASITISNSGDDAFAVMQPSASRTPKYSGLTATGLNLANSKSRGIEIGGGANISISNFNVQSTANAGISVITDAAYLTTRPSNVTIQNGNVVNAGQYPGIAGLQYGVLISAADYVAISNTHVTNSYARGLAITNGSTNISISGAQLVTSGSGTVSEGFFCDSSSLVSVINLRINGTTGRGWESNACGNINASNLTLIDTATNAAALNRAFWVDGSTGLNTVTGMNVIDNQSKATGYTVGEAGSATYPTQVTGITSAISHGTFAISAFDSGQTFYMITH